MYFLIVMEKGRVGGMYPKINIDSKITFFLINNPCKPGIEVLNINKIRFNNFMAVIGSINYHHGH